MVAFKKPFLSICLSLSSTHHSSVHPSINVFITGSHCLTLASMEFSHVDKAGLKTHEIHLSLSPEC